LREEGLTVYGFGERKTPDPFVQACDKFIYTEVLRAEPAPPAATKKAATRKSTRAGKTAPTPAAAPAAAAPAQAAGARSGSLPLPLTLLRQAIEEASDDAGWAPLGAVGNYLNKIRPDFDPRLYGHKKLSDLLRQHPRHFSVEERPAQAGGGKALFVRALT